MEKYIAALDLGTNKIGLGVALCSGDNVQVIYYKEFPSAGIRHSNIFSPKKAEEAIAKAIADAEQELEIKIRQVVVGLPRYKVTTESATAKIQRDAEEYISTEEINAIKDVAIESYPIDTQTQAIYGSVVESFSTEDCLGCCEEDVDGSLSSILEGNFKVFVGKRKNIVAIDRIFNNLQLAVAKKCFMPASSSKIVLEDEEVINGVGLVEIGAGVTSISIYKGGNLHHYAAIPFGGKSITTDISSEALISESLAENIKLAYGACMPDNLGTLEDKTLSIKFNETLYKDIPVKYLAEIIDARVMEIIEAVLYEIQESGMADCLRSGLVITGGSADLINICNRFQEVSGYAVRKGVPRPLFCSSGSAGIYRPSAVNCLGMILDSKSVVADCCQEMKIEKSEESATEGVTEGVVDGEVVTDEVIVSEEVTESTEENNAETVVEEVVETSEKLNESVVEEVSESSGTQSGGTQGGEATKEKTPKKSRFSFLWFKHLKSTLEKGVDNVYTHIYGEESKGK